MNYDYGMTVFSMSDLFFFFFFGHSERQRAKTKHEMPSNVPYFKQQHYDIICLQETHSTKQDIPIYMGKTMEREKHMCNGNRT